MSFKVKSYSDLPYKNSLRIQFKNAQTIFDKRYRLFKRLHAKKELEKLETDAKNNPVEMWASQKRLGNPSCTKAALEIVKDDGSISGEIKEVLNKWFKDISSLFSGF